MAHSDECKAIVARYGGRIPTVNQVQQDGDLEVVLGCPSSQHDTVRWVCGQ